MSMDAATASRDGRCTAGGWTTDGDGPNCTFVGKRSWRGSALLVGSCARNVRRSLERYAQAQVTSLLSAAAVLGGGGVLVFEDEQRSGDPDGTRAALREWAARDRRVRLLLAQPLLYPRWSRTQRLALCRNMLAHEAARLPERGVYVSIDLDCRTPAAAEVVGVLTSMLPALAGEVATAVTRREWDVLTANTRPPAYYYDRWALRSQALTLDYDCWFNTTQRRQRGACPDYAITLDPEAPPLSVDSAFNGLGLYRASAMRRALAADCRYRGTKNSYMCEHVPFHLCMRAASLSIGVLPALTVECGPTIVAPRHTRVRLLANGSVHVVQPPAVAPALHVASSSRRHFSSKRPRAAHKT